jgi:SAM-dependent methyltransferase
LTGTTPGDSESRRDFYGPQYSRFGTDLAAEVRLEAYGEDLGQLGWRTLDEQAEITRLVREHSPSHLIDLACGSGGPSLAIAAATGCRLTAVDIEPGAIKEAGQRSITMGLADRSEFFTADCNQRLPFDDQSFDIVVCIDAVVHLNDRFAALADWFRLLRPGGRMAFSDACIITGAVSRTELELRASHGPCVFVPPGLNEKAIVQAGFRLRDRMDTTQALADIARRLFAAREARSGRLLEEEGADWFKWRQSLLAIISELAKSGRMSRFFYVADKPR